MRFNRLNTATGHDAYATLAFTTVSLNHTGDNAVGKAPLHIEVPTSWPYQSVTALAEQALRLKDVPKRPRRIKESGVPAWLWRSAPSDEGKSTSEHSFKQIFDRVAGAVAYAGWKTGYFSTKQDVQVFHDELRFLLAAQKLAFTPRLYALTGLYWAYGLTGELDHGVWLDPSSNRLRTRILQYEQPLAADNPASQPVDFNSLACAEILAHQQAKTVEYATFALGRRFLQQQLTELYNAACTGNDLPRHARAAEAAGVPQKLVQDTLHAARTGALCPTVPGFPHALPKAASPLVRVTAQDTQNAGARWDDLLHAIQHHGMPELIFASDYDDDGADTPRATLNLAAFICEESAGRGFDHAGFTHAVRIATIALDIALTQTAHHSEEAARRAQRHRTIGLGFANLASLLLALGQAYDSPTGRATAASIAALMTGTAYATSAEIAARCGAAAAYKEVRESVLRQMRQRQRAVYDAPEPHEQQGIALDDCIDLALIAAARRVWDQAVAGASTGLRNMRVSVIADDRTVRDFLGAECCGLAPLRRMAHDRQTGEDTFVFEPLPQIHSACAALGYSAEEQRTLCTWLELADCAAVFPVTLPAAHHALFSTLDHAGTGGMEPAAVIRMAGAVQPFVTGQIEVNLPLPEAATVADIGEYIHMAAKASLTHLHCLRDGSRFDVEAPNNPGLSAAPQPTAFSTLTARKAEQGYVRANFRAVRTRSKARSAFRNDAGIAASPHEKPREA